MPEDDEGRQWIVEPPGQRQVSLHVAVGEGTELTGEQQAALAALLQSLEASDPEVTGHGSRCPTYHPCSLCFGLKGGCIHLLCNGLVRGATSTDAGQGDRKSV